MPTIIPSGTLGPVPGATGASHQGHLVWGQNTRRWWCFTWAGILDQGTATGGDKTQLIDTSKNWTPSAWQAASCVITGGPGAGQAFEIGPNTATVLQVYDNASASPPQPGLPTAVGAGSTYVIVESRYVRAYVSSGPDLSTATWAEATGSPSPILPSSSGIDISGGHNDGGWFGSIPTNGTMLAVGYANVGFVDVVHLLTWENLHWKKYSERVRLGIGAPDRVSWDLVGVVSWMDTFDAHNEALPTFPQACAMGLSTTNRWHCIQMQGGLPNSGMVANPGAIDGGGAQLNTTWGGTYVDLDSTATLHPHQAALAALDGGFMLAVYANGAFSGNGINTAFQTGLRYQESASESTWPSAAGGVAVPNLSSTANDPNDWGIVARTTTDIHVVRRNSATVLEHVRYSGHGGSWSSVVTLPTSGLTGHLVGSGVALVSDGTSVWCFVIDTDANNSVRYLRWTSANGWDSAWSTLPTGAEIKNFITATLGSRQIGVAWTANSTQPFAVNCAALPTGGVVDRSAPLGGTGYVGQSDITGGSWIT